MSLVIILPSPRLLRASSGRCQSPTTVCTRDMTADTDTSDCGQPLRNRVKQLWPSVKKISMLKLWSIVISHCVQRGFNLITPVGLQPPAPHRGLEPVLWELLGEHERNANDPPPHSATPTVVVARAQSGPAGWNVHRSPSLAPHGTADGDAKKQTNTTTPLCTSTEVSAKWLLYLPLHLGSFFSGFSTEHWRFEASNAG